MSARHVMPFIERARRQASRYKLEARHRRAIEVALEDGGFHNEVAWLTIKDDGHPGEVPEWWPFNVRTGRARPKYIELLKTTEWMMIRFGTRHV